MNKSWLLGLVILGLVGCTTPKQMTLLIGNSDSTNVPSIPVYTIDPGDVLQIDFSTISGEGAYPYNSAGTLYTVRNDGTIMMPVLGQVMVQGMTTNELIAYLEQRLVGQIKEPMVRIEISNATITVLGEVAAPARLSAQHPIRLTEVLSMVGGPTRYARLTNVLVQRSESGKLRTYRIDLTKEDLSQTPCYYLQKGDVLYIAPRIAKRIL